VRIMNPTPLLSLAVFLSYVGSRVKNPPHSSSLKSMP
jgi:hypothetical protein